MAGYSNDSSVAKNGTDNNTSSNLEIGSDAGFTVTSPKNASKAGNTTNDNPTFIKNQIAIQRSPSTTAAQVSALSRKLSVKSNGSVEAPIGASISGVLSEDEEEKRAGRGRGRENSTSSLNAATASCSLTKSPSVSTSGSNHSIKSSKSVHSVHAVGSYPLGSLRLHSPSPTRPDIEKRSFLRSGDVMLIRDISPGSLFGYDTRSMSFSSKVEFEGIKAIPAGAHFFWGGANVTSLRSGFWIMTSKKATDELGEIHVKRWDKETEVLDEEHVAAEAMFQKQAIAEVFDKLETYTSSIRKPAPTKKASSHATSSIAAVDKNIWNQLTSCIKGALLTKVTALPWNKWQVLSCHDFKNPVPTIPDDRYPNKTRDEVLRFIFPKSIHFWHAAAIGRERTEQALDSSTHIKSVIHDICTYEDSDEIIGEIQFCYVTGMLIGNYACQEHWAHVVKILFQAFKLALDEPVFFRKVIQAVHAQFSYDHEALDGSILDLTPGLGDELKSLLVIFKSRLNEQLMARGSSITPDQVAVGAAFEAFESWLWKWNWDLRGNYVRSGQFQLEDGEFVDLELKDFQDEDERGEYAPAVVELDDDGRERDLIRF